MKYQWPIEVRKIDGVWHKRAVDSNDRWNPVVWEQRPPGYDVGR